MFALRIAAFAALAASLTVSGCQEAAAPPPGGPPGVAVSRPVPREVVEWDEYTGRLQAVETVDVRAQVGGYLDSVHFKDGQIVEQGDLLFVVDPRPYEAVLAQARAERAAAAARLNEAKARLQQAEAEKEQAESRDALAERRLQRTRQLIERSAATQDDLDLRQAEKVEAAANVAATSAAIAAATAAVGTAEAAIATADAAITAAELNVGFTKVTAPVKGRVGRHLVSVGNLIAGGANGATQLTTIVSLDPIHVYFEPDERSYLKYTRLAADGSRPSSRDQSNPVFVSLTDEDGFAHVGRMDFVDNQMDVQTGTIQGRARIENPDLLFIPNLFVRLRLPGSGRYDALVVPDEAIQRDQTTPFVLVADAEGKVGRKAVTLGPTVAGLRVVRKGLSPDDRVIVKGTQLAQVGGQVDAKEEPVALDEEAWERDTRLSMLADVLPRTTAANPANEKPTASPSSPPGTDGDATPAVLPAAGGTAGGTAP